jgi:bifunctional DNA-binding transcriptional regulator/antitoxin component of YhaV-PrlF toxin-antitoxin module
MPKYICKVNRFKDQFRVTIPRALVKEMGWEDVQVLILGRNCIDYVLMGRYLGGKSLRTKLETGSVKPD